MFKPQKSILIPALKILHGKESGTLHFVSGEIFLWIRNWAPNRFRANVLVFCWHCVPICCTRRYCITRTRGNEHETWAYIIFKHQVTFHSVTVHYFRHNQKGLRVELEKGTWYNVQILPERFEGVAGLTR